MSGRLAAFLFHLVVLVAAGGALTACRDDPVDPGGTLPPPDGPILGVIGRGSATARFNAEVWVHGNYAYTSTWGTRGAQLVPGNAILVWDIRGANPQRVDSVIIPPVNQGVTIRTTGDVQVSDDGRLLIVPTEFTPGSLEIHDLTNPAKPVSIARFTSPHIMRGIHTAEVQRVNGRLYAWLAVNDAATHPSRLIVVDLDNPLAPREILVRDMGNPFIHDVFVRDGLLFTALWNAGLVIWDIGGGGKGGTVENPVEIGRLVTHNGQVHNFWWYHDGATGQKRYLFVGEEGPANLFSSSSGDIHVVDISNPAEPREVAFFGVEGAGTHNFSVDEARGLLYAAYYNAGIQVLDVRGDLGSCSAADQSPDGRCDLRRMGRLKATGLLDQNIPVYVWGVQFTGDAVYASDMLNGIWKLAPATR